MPFSIGKTPLYFNPILWHRLLSQLKISQTNIRLDTAVASFAHKARLSSYMLVRSPFESVRNQRTYNEYRSRTHIRY